jgi:hypothetical protein
LRYLADPFGLWREGSLYVFTEHFDYRDAIGRIAVSEYDAALRLIQQAIVLREPWHLSYPFVFEADGETWLLPESFQSGGLWLYRSAAFPHRWERAARIELADIPLDPTPFHDGERWWLFYTPAYPRTARLTTLCAAYADRIEGPWHTYAGNPFFEDKLGARPGGTPFRRDIAVHLPVQECSGTYGSAVRVLRIDRLQPDGITAALTDTFTAPSAAAPFTSGCHTFSGAGPFTLIDVKRSRISPLGLIARPFRSLNQRRREAAPYRW